MHCAGSKILGNSFQILGKSSARMVNMVRMIDS
jgi:hypothetical protein